MGCTYLSRAENGKLLFTDYPGESLIIKLAAAMEVDADELLLMAEKIPPGIRKRVLERPAVFRRLAELDDQTLDRLMQEMDGETASRG